VHDGAALSDSARLTGSRGLTRRRHRPPAIERHLLEQAAEFISPTSALQRITDSSRTSRQVRKVPILLQKSFLADERNFSGPLMRSARGDVRDHIVLYKDDHGPSYRP
jgi:hypothetical protein